MNDTEDLSAARHVQKVLAAAVKPRALPRSFHDIGDGDQCPDGHGKMLTVQGTDKQHCPHQSHDGIWASGEHRPPTRSTWPSGHISFAAALKAREG